MTRDTERGPGYGIFMISGVGTVQGPVRFSLRRSQVVDPFLSRDGGWQGNETLIDAEDCRSEGGTLLIAVGAKVLDAIVAQSSNTAYQFILATDLGRHSATVRVRGSLLGSMATAAPAPLPDPEPSPAPMETTSEVVEPEPEPARHEETAQEPSDAPTVLHEPGPPASQDSGEIEPAEPMRSRNTGLWVGIAFFAVLLIAAAGYAYLTCRIPGFAPAQCASDQPDSPGEPPAEAEVVRSCKNLETGPCMSAAAAALASGDSQLARELYQQAARKGETAAMLRVAEMYDPDTWSADRSPETEPDWETAAYWYEEAARLGNPEGVRRAGRLLCTHAEARMEIRRGSDFLEQAVAAGAADGLPELLSQCKEKRK